MARMLSAQLMARMLLTNVIGYRTTELGYGTTFTDAGVGIGLKRGISLIIKKTKKNLNFCQKKEPTTSGYLILDDSLP